MQKRGQLNILIYAIVSIVVVFTLVLGYKALTDISEKSREAMLMDFKNSFLADIAPLKYEDVVEKTYSFPEDVTTVCFVDYEALNQKPSAGLSRYPIVKNSIESGAKKNIFLLDSNGDIINSFYIQFKIQNKDDDPEYYCEPVINGKATLKFGGKEGGLKGTAYSFEEIKTIPPSRITEVSMGGITLKVTGGTVGNTIKFIISKKNPDIFAVSDEYNVQFCDFDGKNCGDVPAGVTLDITINYPSCPESKTYTINGVGVVFNGKVLTCTDGKLVGTINT